MDGGRESLAQLGLKRFRPVLAAIDEERGQFPMHLGAEQVDHQSIRERLPQPRGLPGAAMAEQEAARRAAEEREKGDGKGLTSGGRKPHNPLIFQALAPLTDPLSPSMFGGVQRG